MSICDTLMVISHIMVHYVIFTAVHTASPYFAVCHGQHKRLGFELIAGRINADTIIRILHPELSALVRNDSSACGIFLTVVSF